MYYLYTHTRLDTNTIFYIGIGTIRKRIKYTKELSHKYKYERAYSKSGRNKIWKNIINKGEYSVNIILESDNLEFIKNKEIEFIKLYGRKNLNEGSLCNLTDGGEGAFNVIISEDRKKELISFLRNYNNALDKPIHKYSLWGELIKCYKNSFELEEETAKDYRKKVVNACNLFNKKIIVSDESFWSYTQISYNCSLFREKLKNNEYFENIYVYSLDGIYINKYNNIYELCFKNSINRIHRKKIRDVLKSSNYAFGYIFSNSALSNEELYKIMMVKKRNIKKCINIINA